MTIKLVLIKICRVTSLVCLIFFAIYPFSFGITSDSDVLNDTSALSLTVVPILYGLAMIPTMGFFASLCTSTLIGYILLIISWLLASEIFLQSYLFTQQGFNLYNLGLLLPALPNLYHTFHGRVQQHLMWVNFLVQLALCAFVISLIINDIAAWGNPLHDYYRTENIFSLAVGVVVSALIWVLVKHVFLNNLRMYTQLAAYVEIMGKPTIGFFTGYLTIMLLFAGLYSLCYYHDPSVFNKINDNTFAAMLYYSFSIITGLGFSVIEPEKPITFFLTGLENFLGLVWVTVVFAGALAYFQEPFKAISRAQKIKNKRQDSVNKKPK